MPRVIRGHTSHRWWLSIFLLLLAVVSCWKVEPDLTVSPNAVNFDSFIDSIAVQVRNDSEDNALTTGVDVLNYQLKCDKPWVKVLPASGTCGEMEKQSHLVIVDRSLMPFGENLAIISVTSNGGSATINVRAVRTVPGCGDKPDAPHTPEPPMAATGVSVNPEISWEGGDSRCSPLRAKYDVYFGDTTPPPFHHTDSLKVWSPPEPLTNNKIYYWRIVAKDANGSTSGPEWRFRTVCILGPSDVTTPEPANNATDVSVITNLSWRGGDSRCAGLNANYDLYFGTTNPPPFHHNTGSIKTWYAGILTKSTTYYWRVVANDANGSNTSPVAKFTTVAQPCITPPSSVSLQSPSQGATDVPLTQELSWTGGNSQCEGLSATYDVYFGTVTPPPLHHNNGASMTWDPGTLEYDAIYYWRIVAKDASGSTTSSERWFRTPCNRAPGALTLVSPASGSTGASVDVNLLWGGGNSICAGLTSTYDVYFGTTSPPPFLHNNAATKNWDPGTLAGSTKYYWKIVAKDANGDTAGPVWNFTTEAQQCTAAPGSPALSLPGNGATGQPIDTNLSWTGGNSQCEGLTATYDVYFGVAASPPLAGNSGSTKAWEPGALLPLTKYYWKVTAKDSNGSTSSTVRNFTTGALPCTDGPTDVSIGSPANGASDVPTDANLSWGGGNSQCVGLTATYDVYFGTQNPPPLDGNSGTTKSWEPGPLASGTTYYWRITAKDDNGSEAGPVWSFETAPAVCELPPAVATIQSPANNSTGISINANLNWSGGSSRCEGLTATYDVYFGTVNPPPLARNTGTTKNFDAPTLEYSTKYYWQVVAKDANGATPGPVWSFTTETPCLSAPAAPCSPTPFNGRTGVNENQNLSWSCGGSQCGLAVTYDVYLGTTPLLTDEHKKGSTAEKSLNLPKLNSLTTYYWKVIARDANGSTSSALWVFTTRAGL